MSPLRRTPAARARRRAALLALTALALPGCGGERPGEQPEHLLLVTYEGVRADHCSAWLYPRPTTYVARPDDQRALDLDWVCETGVQLADAFADSPDPRAALVALMTGRAPAASGVVAAGDALPEGTPTLAEQLSAAGFRTAAFVAPSEALSLGGLERGFERFDQDADDVALAGRAVEWLKGEFDPERPTFLWLHFGAAAPPWDPRPFAPNAPGFKTLFLPEGVPLDVTADRAFLDSLRAGERELSANDEVALVALYDADVARAVQLSRQVLEYYKHAHFDQDPWGRSWVVMAGLDGCALGEAPRAWGREARPLDRALHVPLAMRHPNSLTGRRVFAAPVTLADVAPTVRELFDLPATGGASGRSLLALFDSWRPRALAPRPALAVARDAAGRASVAVRDGRWRLVVEARGAGEPPSRALYDLELDPAEREDRAAVDPARAARLAAEGLRVLEETGGDEVWAALLRAAAGEGGA